MINFLVKISDILDQKGKHKLSDEVDKVIVSLAARPKSPLKKKVDDKVKKSLLKFLGQTCEHLRQSVESLEELSRRLRYFNIDGQVKKLGLNKTLDELRDLYSKVDMSSKKFYEYSFGKKPSKDYLKDILKDDEQDSDDPFEFTRMDGGSPRPIPERQVPEEDSSLTGRDIDVRDIEDVEDVEKDEVDEFWEESEENKK